MIGGKFGATVPLPSGTYSDDTQLRLSTTRAILGDGMFDVEAFAKVELPVWLSYALGGGRATKQAAISLSKSNVSWFSNFFQQGDVSYISAGGNGAAMRIQPHVWAAADLADASTYVPDVFRNAICTHGHPRAIFGAVVHARALAHVLRTGSIPEPAQWEALADERQDIERTIDADDNLKLFWLPTSTERGGRSWIAGYYESQREWISMVREAMPGLDRSGPEAYESIARSLGAFDPKNRGSGIKTAFFALLLSWLHREIGVERALIAAVNHLGSDTDTIATMAGALMGALSITEPDGDIGDRNYINVESERLFEVSQKRKTGSFPYPDLLHWEPPKSSLDALGLVGSNTAVAGLSYGKKFEDMYPSRKRDIFWQWIVLEFGQTLLCKSRETLKPLPTSSRPLDPAATKSLGDLIKLSPTKKQAPMAVSDGESTEDMFVEKLSSIVHAKDSFEQGIDELTDNAIRGGFEPATVGRHLLELSERENGIDLAIAYAAIIAKAKRARRRRGPS
jgi:ADP-ribosylglycohydrolase